MIFRSFCSLFSFFLCLANGVGFAAETQVDTGPVHLYSGAGGSVVQVPGVSINVPSSVPTSAVGTVSLSSSSTMERGIVAREGRSYVNGRLEGMDFSHQDLAGADFSNALLSNANFAGANLSGAHFTNATLTHVNFVGARLVGADLTNAVLSEANLTQADFSHALLINATLYHAVAIGTHFDGASLQNVDMNVLVRTPETRPVFVDARTISRSLTVTSDQSKAHPQLDITINFDTNSDKLTHDGLKQIEPIATAIQDTELSHSRIMVQGHTDDVGTDEYNKDLSYRRALRVVRTLVDQYHVDPARLSAQGFGKTQPVASNQSDLGRAMNRRVTLVNLGS